MERGQPVEPITLSYASKRSVACPSPILSPLRALVVWIVFSLFFAAFFIPTTRHDHTACSINLTRANVGNLITPLELYRVKFGAYPISLNNLDHRPPGMTQQAWGGPYIKNVDNLKDAWGRPLRYRAPGIQNPRWYDLWSTGKDGVDGTRDDIKNW